MSKKKLSIIEQIEKDNPELIGMEVCPDCNGEGWIGIKFGQGYGHRCWKCNGKGMLKEEMKNDN